MDTSSISYFLCYQGKSIYQMSPEEYDTGDFKISYMPKTFTEKKIVDMFTDCYKCRTKTNRVIPQFELDNGTIVLYCEKCRSDWEFRGGKA